MCHDIHWLQLEAIPVISGEKGKERDRQTEKGRLTREMLRFTREHYLSGTSGTAKGRA